MWCGKKGIDCNYCGVFGECQKSVCGLPNAEPSTLGTSAVYFVNTTLEQFIADMKYEAVEEFAEKIKEYINSKVIADFGDSESVKYYTIDLDEFEREIDKLLKEYEK